MGLDIDIKARIKETTSGRCISIQNQSYCYGGENRRYYTDRYQWFTVLWTCSWSAYPLLQSWIEIINRYTKSNYNANEDIRIPFPQSALREMCSCLYSYGCVPDENRFQWNLKCGFWDIPQRDKNHNIPYSTEKPYESIDWDYLKREEYDHLYKAKYLRAFIYFLEQIYYNNKYVPLIDYDDSMNDSGKYIFIDDIKYVPLRATNDGLNEYGKYIFIDEFIEDPSDLQAFKDNPQAYTWEFELFNSQ